MDKYKKFVISHSSLVILAGLAIILFFFKLGAFSLYDAAETTYGEFIKQMRLTGDWITFHYNGEIIFDKPPLYYWLAAIMTYIFGFTEFAIRFWAALCGVLTVAATYFLGKSFYNKNVGFMAGLIVMTALQFLVQSRIAELDILLTLLITLTFLFFWQRKYLLMYLCMALGMLVKGLIGVAIPGLAIFLFLVVQTFRSASAGRSKDLHYFFDLIKQLKIIPGIIIILAVGLPWYLIEWLIHGQEFLNFALGFLFLSRFQGVVSGHPGPWYYYFLALTFGFFPWSHFLPYALTRTWKERLAKPELLSLCFIIPVFIVFSVAKTKLPNYVLPIYPFLAIMVARTWDEFMGKPETERLGFQNKKGMVIANILLLIIAVLMIIGFIILGTSNYSGQYYDLMPHLKLLAGVLIGGSLISVIAFFLKNYQVSFYSLPTMVFVIALILTTLTLPAVENYKGSKFLGQKVAENIQENEVIAAYEAGNRPSVVLHNVKPVTYLDSYGDVVSLFRTNKGYLFIETENYKKIKQKMLRNARIFSTKGDLTVIYYE